MQQTNCEKLYPLIIALALAIEEGHLLGTLCGIAFHSNRVFTNKAKIIILFRDIRKNFWNSQVKPVFYNQGRR